jgi:hypothetical protein
VSARTSLYFDLLEACARPGCPICQLGRRAVERYLDIFSYENVNDLDARARLRAARGFCNRHAWEWWEEHHDRLGIAIVYLDVLTTIHRQLTGLSEATPSTWRGQMLTALGLDRNGRAPASTLLPAATCPACELQGATEERAIVALLQHFEDGEVQTAFASSNGLCVPHLARALQSGPSPALSNLIRLERDRIGGLLAELEEFLRKAREEFRHEPRGHEQTAPRRGLSLAAGLPGASWPSNQDA